MTTVKRAIKYLTEDSGTCPHCESANLEAANPKFVDGEILQHIACIACNESWTDVYKLAAVVTPDGETIASIAIPEEGA